jgi:CDP-diacylglycerol--glycerol-3-phosphate 3-phosphatidyltransferase
VLICGTFAYLCTSPVLRDDLPTWVVVLIIAREFLVTSIRGMAEAGGRAFPADRLGKWKMVFQSLAAGFFLGYLAGAQWARPLAVVCLWVAVALTVVSAVGYVWKARDLVST